MYWWLDDAEAADGIEEGRDNVDGTGVGEVSIIGWCTA